MSRNKRPRLQLTGALALVIFLGSLALSKGPASASSAANSDIGAAEKQMTSVSGTTGGRSEAATASETFATYLPFVTNRWPLLLYVGMQVRWDGQGYVRGGQYYDIGYHQQMDFNGMTDDDTIRAHISSWYDPNPTGLAPQNYDNYYSASTGYFKSSSMPPDPSWKWAAPWLFPPDWRFSNSQTVLIGGQAFLVSGPLGGYTSFGRAVQYWQMVNRDKFLIWDGGGDWKQYVHPGDVVLRYDSAFRQIQLYDSTLRREYYRDRLTSTTVQYIMNLTGSNTDSNAASKASIKPNAILSSGIKGGNPGFSAPALNGPQE